jgi:tetratricopeptide (TPR) repeat protein
VIRGTLLSNLQKYREAIEEYTKALNSGQDLEEIYANIAFEYENLEQYDKAVEYLTKVVTINPENEAGLNEIGICFEMSNRSEKSLEYPSFYAPPLIFYRPQNPPYQAS